MTSLTLHRFEGLLNGRPVGVAGIGELSTPHEFRGRRYGAALIEDVLDRSRRDRLHLAMLFSDIGAGPFIRLGFSPLPGEEAACVAELPAPWPQEPGWVGAADPPRGVPGMRIAGPADAGGLARLRDRHEGRAPLRLMRDREEWERLLAREKVGSGLQRDGEGSIWLIEDRDGPAAYAALRVQGSALRWLEHGVGPGGERRLEQLFWAAIATARRLGLARLEGWTLPDGAAGETLYPIARRARREPLLLARVLDPGVSLSGLRAAADCRVSELDRF